MTSRISYFSDIMTHFLLSCKKISACIKIWNFTCVTDIHNTELNSSFETTHTHTTEYINVTYTDSLLFSLLNICESRRNKYNECE